MMKFPIYGKIKHLPNDQPVISDMMYNWNCTPHRVSEHVNFEGSHLAEFEQFTNLKIAETNHHSSEVTVRSV